MFSMFVDRDSRPLPFNLVGQPMSVRVGNVAVPLPYFNGHQPNASADEQNRIPQAETEIKVSRSSRARHGVRSHRTLPEEGILPEVTGPNHRQRSQRQKQIAFGLVTDGYRNFRAHYPALNESAIFVLPKDILEICIKTGWDPETDIYWYPPKIDDQLSKRTFDESISKWRRFLHLWDTKTCPLGYENNPDWIASVLPTINEAKLLVAAIMESKHCPAVQEDVSAPLNKPTENEFNLWDLELKLDNMVFDPRLCGDPLPVSPRISAINVSTFFNQAPLPAVSAEVPFNDEELTSAF